MSLLLRRDPMLREMNAWRSAMDRLFNEMLSEFGEPRVSYDQAAWALALDVAEKDDAFIVKASLPGINPDDLEITLTDNVLTIKGEIKEDKDFEEGQWHLRERRYGAFQRSITLPTPVDSNKIDATYKDGVITLHVPKVEEVKPKRITVKAKK